MASELLSESFCLLKIQILKSKNQYGGCMPERRRAFFPQARTVGIIQVTELIETEILYKNIIFCCY